MIDIDILLSPKDGSKLKLENNKILKDKIGTIFHVINGIPRFVSSDNYASSFGKQWNYFKSTQLDKYNGTNITEKRFFDDTHWLKDELKGQKILEVGSGAGRFTQILLDYGAEVHSVDYSNAVDANLDNNGPNDKLYIYQADIYKLPFKEKLFDKVFCFGVLQHTPDVKASFMDLTKFVKPGGKIAVDVYPKTWKTIFHQKYWYRLLTNKIPNNILLKIIKFYVPKWFSISTWCQNVPVLGYMSQFIPISNYSGTYYEELKKTELIEWAIMDTFDMLSPKYDQPQSLNTLSKWFNEANITIEYIGKGINGYVGCGIKI